MYQNWLLFSGQLLTLTFPMVGNYGVPDPSRRDEIGLEKGFESYKIHASALVVQDYAREYSHWDAHLSLGDWLKQEGIPGLTGFDTRMLTRKIRAQGSMKARIDFPDQKPVEFEDPNARNLVAEVSVPEVRVFGKGNSVKVLAVDCGIKNNIIRELVRKGAEVTVVPWDYKFSEAVSEYDGLFLSNGPGDPTKCVSTIEELKKVIALEGSAMRPIFGICLGNQLMALAAGASAVKMPFGNRGQNQPVRNVLTGECYITPQNHGFAIDDSKLPSGWKTLFTNANDGTNEGIMHENKPFFSAQFHPEAQGGPTDTAHFFDQFLDHCKDHGKKLEFKPRNDKPVGERPKVSKVLLLGSGGLSIGQAGEFDYSGAQAIKALKEEGLQVVLMNPNIASVQTNIGEQSEFQADQVFFLPVTPDFVEQVIARERPDGIVISMGGQTALNCGIELHDTGIFEKYGVQVLGTQIQVIKDTEDRQLFSDKIGEIGEKIAKSFACDTMKEAVTAAREIGYPVMIRSAYSLGGLGSCICDDEEMLLDMGAKAFSMSPQILVEQSMLGWKEVEYEVVRDAWDNCVTVCNMENFDALGVHTGDSIVIAPSQTLSNEEYHMLRRTAIDVVRHLGIVGECNIQYALHPTSLEYCIIEVNARLSRSSALASKATGYPLAYVAAKLSLGVDLVSIRNSVTKTTTACFEPSLDYCVVKMPRWDLHKFPRVSNRLGSSMLSVGEVMAIGRSFEEAIQKAVRMVAPGSVGLEGKDSEGLSTQDFEAAISKPTDKRLYQVQAALEMGYTVDKLHDLSKIDRWFLQKLKNIQLLRQRTESMKDLLDIDAPLMRSLKRTGFSDIQVANYLDASPDKSKTPNGSKSAAKTPGSGANSTTELAVRRRRQQLRVVPVVKQIDTLAAEFPAQTNYLYMTYHGTENDVPPGSEGVMVLGCGAYCIGSSVEFDWSAVSAVRTLRGAGFKAIVVNYNPETVSTDYDESDRLYFEELSCERVLDVYEHENAGGVIVSVGGQIAQNVCGSLKAQGVRILGTDPDNIDRAEDRHKFSALLDDLHIDQPAWRELATVDQALSFAADVGYPVLVRPSFVLSGAAMNVATNAAQLRDYLGEAVCVSGDKPVVVSKFITAAKEIEFDAVAQGGRILNYAISEHVENAGVHSGDATLVLPAQNLYQETVRRIKKIGQSVAKALDITGPFNMQLMAKANEIKVIECNLRASRTFPFVSKTLNANFIKLATKAMLGLPVKPYQISLGDIDYVGVKAAMFSFTRLRGSDPVLGVEMASTGEVACFGDTVFDAFRLAFEATGFKMPSPGAKILVSIAKSDEVIFQRDEPEIQDPKTFGY
mmetsp:Transcript_69997/g.158248  ORF Transcript_69997/g.158248 Transcript_69997/m.158248 type:complete len:1336 (-) Transcript_69997:184-4191(-)